MNNVVSDEILDHYFEVTERAYNIVKISVPQSSHLYPIAKDFLNMAKAYIEDAKYFRSKGDYIRALGSIYYAHGWLDAGARLGIFDVGENHELFTLAK